MLKKIILSILCFILFILLTTASINIVTRNIFSKSTITQIIDHISEKYEKETNEKIFTSTFTLGYQETDPKLKEYFDEDILKEEIATILTNYFLVSADLIEIKELNTNNLESLINKNISIYEKNTNKKIDRLYIDTLISEINYNIQEINNFPKKASKIIKIIYSKKIYYIMIIICIICIISIIFIKNNIIAAVKSISIRIIFSGISLLSLGLALNSIFKNSDELIIKITNIITENFYKIGGINLLIGIIIFIIARKNNLANTNQINNQDVYHIQKDLN